MRSLLIDDTGDLVFENGDLQMSSDIVDVKQSVRIILQTRLEEFYFDQDLGLSHDNLWGKDYDLEFLEQDISESILEQETRIQSVDDIVFNLDEGDRQLSVIVKMTKDDESEVESEVLIDA